MSLKKTMRKMSYCCLTVLLLSGQTLSAQIIKLNPLKRPTRPYYEEGMRSHWIDEDKYYNFRIQKISPLIDGYVIRATTSIAGKKVNAAIISPFSDTIVYQDYKYLRRGNRYPLAVQRYFIVPAKRIGMESGSVEDVLLGNKTVNVNNSGCFYYIFTSKNLNGKQVFPKAYVDSLNRHYCEDSLIIHQTIKQFIEFFSLQKQNSAVLDTDLIKESILRYGGDWCRNFDEQWWPYGDRSWWLDSIPKRMDWSKETFADKSIDTTSFSQLFLKVSSWHKLPLLDSLCDREITNIAYKFLYYTHPGIFTVHVTWEIEGIDKIYATIVNVQKSNERYRITALNKPYGQYGQMEDEGNRRMFELNERFEMIFN